MISSKYIRTHAFLGRHFAILFEFAPPFLPFHFSDSLPRLLHSLLRELQWTVEALEGMWGECGGDEEDRAETNCVKRRGKEEQRGRERGEKEGGGERKRPPTNKEEQGVNWLKARIGNTP